MVTYYTALGRMITRDENGTKIPVIIIDDKEYHLSIEELIVWGSLHWNFMVKQDIENEYKRKTEETRMFNDISFEQVLSRLEFRKLVVSGCDYLAADALYKLISILRIRPVRFSLFDKIKSCMYMYFKQGISLKKCISAYFIQDTTQNEKKVLKLSRYAGITPSEIIKCAEESINKINSEDDIMENLYDDGDTTLETIVTDSRFSQLKTDVLNAVANLYLKKKIIFEY